MLTTEEILKSNECIYPTNPPVEYYSVLIDSDVISYIKIDYENKKVLYVSISIDSETKLEVVRELTMDIFTFFNIGDGNKQDDTILENSYEHTEDSELFLDFVTAMPRLNGSLSEIYDRVQKMYNEKNL